MSNSLAIAATTLTLRALLEKEIPLRDAGLPGLKVTTLPPDLARKNAADVGAQLNVFLYQTAVNAAWRNQSAPTQTRPGETGRPPLALNLHYLLTAYGDDTDDESISHRVLGGAMGVLHDHALLGRDEIRGALAGNDLADQFERLRVTPLTLPMDEMSKLWTALQTNYRVSAGYEVTVVLIDSLAAARAALPVLTRGKDDRGPEAAAGLAPQIAELVYLRAQQAARLGERVVLKGTPFDRTKTMLRFTSTRLAAPLELPPLAGGAPDEVAFELPAAADPAAADWVPGWYSLAAVVGAAGGPKLVSNEVAFALAPTISIATVIGVNADDPALRDVAIAVTGAPRCIAGQRVTLAFGDRQADAVSPPVPPPWPALPPPFDPTFDLKKVAPGQTYLVRLRVDGVDSIPVIVTGAPPLPAFDPAQQVAVP